MQQRLLLWSVQSSDERMLDRLMQACREQGPAVSFADGSWHAQLVKDPGAPPPILEPSYCEPDPRPPKLRCRERDKAERKAKTLAKIEMQRSKTVR